MAGPRRDIRVRDALLVGVVAAVFTAIGLWMAVSGGEKDRRTGIASAVFFGLCLGTAVWIVRARRARARSLAARSVEIVGSVPISMRVGRLALLLAIIAAVMAVLAGAAAPSERTMRVLAEAVAVLSAGAVPVILFARRKAVVFEPEGLRLVEWRYDVRVPWDQIAGARILEIEDTLLVALTLRDPVKLAPIPRARHADPSATQRRLARAMRLCRATFGCDLTLGPAAHGLDPILFLRAIETYVADPAALPRLAPRRALACGDHPPS